MLPTLNIDGDECMKCAITYFVRRTATCLLLLLVPQRNSRVLSDHDEPLNYFRNQISPHSKRAKKCASTIAQKFAQATEAEADVACKSLGLKGLAKRHFGMRDA
jgi:hypothetical protein